MRLESPSWLRTVGLVSWGTQDRPTGGSSLLSVPALAEEEQDEHSYERLVEASPLSTGALQPLPRYKIKALPSPSTVETMHQGL